MADAGWSDVPSDLLWKIIEQLPIVDYIRFEGVCVSWRAALDEKLRQPVPQSPWLIRAYNAHNCTARFWSPSDNKEYTFRLPDIFRGYEQIGSSVHGWLYFMNFCNTKITMFQPITKVHVQFPSVATIDRDDKQHLCQYVKVVILPYRETSSVISFIAVAIISHNSGPTSLVVSRKGDKSWVTINTLGNDYFVDVLFYKDQLYTLDGTGLLLVFDISDVSSPKLNFTVEPPPIFGIYCLVESSGDLLMVIKQMELNELQRGGYNTTDIHIFKLDTSKKWVVVKSLGHHAILLSQVYEQSVCISTHDVRGLKANCIYLMDRLRSSWNLRVYHMEYKSFVPLPNKWRLKRKFLPPIWYTPTLSSCQK